MLTWLVGRGDAGLPFLLRLFGWKSRWVDTARGRFHFFEVRGTGTGPPIVLVHGLGSRAADWASLVRVLRPITRRILLPDLPGHGWSPGETPTAEELRAILDEGVQHMLTEPSYVIGNSLGGMVAVRIAGVLPDRVRALLLLSPAGAPLIPEEVELIRGTFAISRYGQALDFIDRLMGRRTNLRYLLAAGLLRRLARPAVRAILEGIRPEDSLTADEVSSLKMPIWFMWGGSDRILPVRHLEWYQSVLPGHTDIELPADFGHSPFMDHPRGFSKRLLLWLAAVEARLTAGDVLPPR